MKEAQQIIGKVIKKLPQSLSNDGKKDIAQQLKL